ncbi:programmed cell death 1 ligand 2-like [Mantella aurantiaca]
MRTQKMAKRGSSVGPDHVCEVADSPRLKRLQMDKARYLLSVLVLCSQCTSVCGLLTVHTMKSSYTAEYGGLISMECRFTVQHSTNLEKMIVIWKHIYKGSTSEVAKYSNGKNVEILRDKDYSNRVRLLSDELYNGRAILKINNVMMTDAGQYLCIIDSQGSDFKVISLEVQAPYKQINTKVTDVVTSSGQTMKELSCQSVGYPKAEVTWLSGSGNISAINNVSNILTAEGLFNVTSVIRISSTANGTFTCIFWNEALQNSSSQNFTLSEISNDKQHAWTAAVVIIMLLIVLILLSICIYGHCKGHYQKRITEYNSFHSGDTLGIDNSGSATSKYSEYSSERTVIDVENT